VSGAGSCASGAVTGEPRT